MVECERARLLDSGLREPGGATIMERIAAAPTSLNLVIASFLRLSIHCKSRGSRKSGLTFKFVGLFEQREYF